MCIDSGSSFAIQGLTQGTSPKGHGTEGIIQRCALQQDTMGSILHFIPVQSAERVQF